MLTLIAALSLTAAEPPRSADLSTAHRLVMLADYLATDYPGAVAGARVIDPAEYEEQRSLSRQAESLAASLGDAELARRFAGLRERIDRREDAGLIAADCRAGREALVQRFQLPTFPRTAPDLASARTLYRHACAPCHGAEGQADTDLARTLDPAPRRFADAEVRQGLSPYRVFNTASFGVTGTAMPAFGETLSERERWDLAFFVLSLGSPPPDRSAASAFGAGSLPSTLPDLAIATDGDLLARALAARLAPDQAQAAVAYARHRAPGEAAPEPIELARRLVAESLATYRTGLAEEAASLALDGYLRGVEPAEGLLRATAPRLTSAIEQSFVEYREALRRQAAPERVEILAAELDALLVRAHGDLRDAPRSGSYAFLASLTIVLREGLEAALVIGSLLTLLGRLAPEQPRLRRSVHAAWVAALAFGGLTWLVAERLLPIDPGNREAAEGVIALIASALLFSASYWLLSNLEVRRWLGFLQRQVSRSLGAGRGLTLFSLAFLAVYREAFETVLFFQALLLGASGAGAQVLAGAAAGLGLLAVIVFAVFQLGARLPLKPFFASTSLLLGVLSFVLAGQGVYALQQAGWLPSPSIPLPALPSLGIHPTIPGLAVQGSILVLFAVAAIYSLVLVPARQRARGREHG